MFFRKKAQILSTPGGKATLRDAISTIFGLKAEKDNLLEIIDTLPDEKIRKLCGVVGEGKILDVLQYIFFYFFLFYVNL